MHFGTRTLARGALIAAVYAALGFLASAFNLAFGPVQLRFSEALCVLPFLFPEAAWGLFVGCLLTNLLSPYGPLDLIVGSAATLLAGILSARCKTRLGAAVPPVLCNALMVGALIAWETTPAGTAFAAAFAYHALTIGLSEAVMCVALGLPLLRLLEKHGALRERER